MASQDDGLKRFDTLLGKLVTGEIKVLNDEGPNPEDELSNRFKNMDLETQRNVSNAFQNVMKNAAETAASVMGDEKKWINYSLNLLILINSVETHPDTSRFVQPSGEIDINKIGISYTEIDLREIMERTIDLLFVFLKGNDGLGRQTAVAVLARTGHNIKFFGEKIGDIEYRCITIDCEKGFVKARLEA